MPSLEDYPRDLLEFEARFSTDALCREYLVQLRWPEGFRCPDCNHDRAWAVRDAALECARCHRHTRVTAGTIFQDTKKPLRVWFRAIWYVTSQKNGASALGLQRILGIRTSAASKKAFPAGKPSKKRSSQWLQKRTVAVSAAFGC